MEIKFTVYGNPVPKLRARTARTKAGFNVAYTPDKTREWEKSILGQALNSRPPAPLNGEIWLGVKIYRQIPKSFSRRKREMAERGEIRPITRPDLANYIKSVEDAIEGVYYSNDSQVVGYLEGVGKYYSETPRIEVVVLGMYD